MDAVFDESYAVDGGAYLSLLLRDERSVLRPLIDAVLQGRTRHWKRDVGTVISLESADALVAGQTAEVDAFILGSVEPELFASAFHRGIFVHFPPERLETVRAFGCGLYSPQIIRRIYRGWQHVVLDSAALARHLTLSCEALFEDDHESLRFSKECAVLLSFLGAALTKSGTLRTFLRSDGDTSLVRRVAGFFSTQN